MIRPANSGSTRDRSTPRASHSWAFFVLAAALGGCSVKGKWSENDQLREDLQGARDQIARVTAERDEARATLAEADRVRLSGGETLGADAAAALPRCVAIEVENVTGLRDADRSDSRPFDTIDVYLRPSDSRGRFVQVVGRVNLRADLIPMPAAGDSPPLTLASLSAGPGEVRDAYRASFMALDYAFQLPLPPDPLPSSSAILITAEFLDALSGSVHRAERIIRLDEPRRYTPPP